MESGLNIFNKMLSSSGSVALLVFILTVLFVSISSIIIFFHWKKYVISSASFAFIETLYLSIIVILLGTAFFSLI